MAARGSAIPASGSFNSFAAGIDFYPKKSAKKLATPPPLANFTAQLWQKQHGLSATSANRKP
jgi:hypothetical protein